jgi:hypothetical protein
VYPVVFDFTRQMRHSRLLLLLRPVLILPHVLWVNVYTAVAVVVWLLSAVMVLVTGRHPRSLWDILDGYFRYACKVNAYVVLLSDTYPPFGGGSEHPFPVRISCRYTERMGRAGVLFRGILLVPQILSSIALAIGAAVFLLVIGVTVLLLGRMPLWQWTFTVTQYVYLSRVAAYALLLTDVYPPFNGAQPLSVETLFREPEVLLDGPIDLP